MSEIDDIKQFARENLSRELTKFQIELIKMYLKDPDTYKRGIDNYRRMGKHTARVIYKTYLERKNEK